MATSRVLRHLKFDCCPTCSSRIKSETFSGRTHCNGQQFEDITFQCGSKIAWIPNFSRHELEIPCPKSQAEEEKYLRKADIMAAILNATHPYNLSNEERRRLISFLEYEFKNA